jgi:hypothetical protein
VNRQDEYAAELGRRVIAALAPRELPLFDETWQALGGRSRRARRREEPLGFGLPEAGDVLLTAVASGVITTVLQDLGKDAGSKLARLRRKPAAAQRPDPLPPQRLAEIRKVAHAKARKLGLDERRATALADAVVSELATSPAAAPRP